MRFFSQSPFFKVSVSLLIGMIFLRGPFLNWILLSSILLLFLALLLWFDRKLLSAFWEVSYLLLSLGCGALLGASLFHSQLKTDGRQLQPFEDQTVQVLGEISSVVKKNAYGQKCFLEVIAVKQKEELIPCEGKILVYFPGSSDVSYSRFDSIWVEGRIKQVQSKYPSYLTYLKKKGISHSLFSSRTHLQGTRKEFMYWSSHAQKILSNRLAGFLGDSLTQAVGLAITIGDKDGLYPELREVFSQAGASHILAISGLHIGIIYLVLNGVLSLLHAFPGGKRVKYLLILLSLQLYMFVTGASPAVVRAVIMFSTILIFQLSSQRYHILNVLALSALVQLLIHPDILFEVGFQLSYLAVMGIVWAYPHFEKLFEEEAWLVRQLMATIGVSLFATLFTAPVIWLVFGKFPTYFLITNLCITVVSFVTVLSGFLTLCFVWFSPVATVLGWVCQKSVLLMVWICEKIVSFPSPVIQIDQLDVQALWILGSQLLLVTAIIFWFRIKKRFLLNPE